MSTTPPINRRLNSSVLSALCKMELIQLSLEFKLLMDGSVINLRNHLKCYLNFNCDMLYRNPRFNALFPRHRRNNPHPSPHPSSHTLHASSPDLSYCSLSPAESFGSWHGIENDLHGSQDANPLQLQLLPMQAQGPPVPSSLPLPVSSSSSGSEHGPPPPAVIQLDHCMLFFIFPILLFALCLYVVLKDTMQPLFLFLYMI
jgi:hypothetical protein